ERYHQAFVQHLLAHPPALCQLLRSSAVEALLPAKKMLEAEYGWGRISDQQLLQPLIAELEPAAQAYFTEELEVRLTDLLRRIARLAEIPIAKPWGQLIALDHDDRRPTDEELTAVVVGYPGDGIGDHF